MPLEKYEDFLDLLIKDPTNYLSVHGLNTSGRKVELVARAFSAFELKMNIIASSEEQKLILESDYLEMLSKHGLVDPMSIEKNKRIDDMTRWPFISLGISLLLHYKKKCATRNILDTIRTKKHIHIGIVDLLALFTYMKHMLKKNHVFLYSPVKASQAMTDIKEVWIASYKKSQTENQILCA